MKVLKSLIILVSLISLTNCGNVSIEKESHTDVEKYVKLLKSERYDSVNLPAFTHNDIPALLEYRNETQIITKYPRNPISSFASHECRLGVYILWTIESIRVGSDTGDIQLMRFPSLNPILSGIDSEGISDDVSHSMASQAYLNWWENNSKKDFTEYKNIDPLSNTGFKWR